MLAVMVLGGALLILDAIDTQRHRYVNLAVVIDLVARGKLRSRGRLVQPALIGVTG